MSRDRDAVAIGEALGIRYAYALRLVKDNRQRNQSMADLTLACRRQYEEEAAKPKKQKTKRGCLPAGAGKVICPDCGAWGAADGRGTPIVVRCKDDCPAQKRGKNEDTRTG